MSDSYVMFAFCLLFAVSTYKTGTFHSEADKYFIVLQLFTFPLQFHCWFATNGAADGNCTSLHHEFGLDSAYSLWLVATLEHLFSGS